ncbi:MAG: ATP-binding protein [Candidatus Hodarchaeales archaeon]|jgi:signal transduction histidine kinase
MKYKNDILTRIGKEAVTTKSMDEGIGLGLLGFYDIVEQHGGTIDIETEIGKGTKFVVKLPLNKE